MSDEDLYLEYYVRTVKRVVRLRNFIEKQAEDGNIPLTVAIEFENLIWLPLELEDIA